MIDCIKKVVAVENQMEALNINNIYYKNEGREKESLYFVDEFQPFTNYVIRSSFVDEIIIKCPSLNTYNQTKQPTNQPTIQPVNHSANKQPNNQPNN